MFQPQTVQVHLSLDLPRQQGDLYLFSHFSQWKPADMFRFDWVDGKYQLTLTLPMGQLLECRVSLEDLEEADLQGLKRVPRVITATTEQHLHFEVAGFVQTTETPSTRTGHIEEHTLYSPELQDEARLLVQLPPQYFQEPDRHFPVVYLHDGHNVFDRATSSYGFAWECDEAAEALAAQGHPVIQVGVWTDQQKRMAYYVPHPSHYNQFQPQGKPYLDFLAHTLKPHIDGQFRTLPDRETTAVCGSSLGGIISLYAGLYHPEVYGTVGVMSPALWISEYRAFEDVMKEAKPQVRHFVDMGDREGRYFENGMNLVRMAHELAGLLHAKGCEVELQIGEGHLHHESAWQERYPLFLQFFVNGWTAGPK